MVTVPDQCVVSLRVQTYAIKGGDSCGKGEMAILCLGGRLRTTEVQKSMMDICKLLRGLFLIHGMRFVALTGQNSLACSSLESFQMISR